MATATTHPGLLIVLCGPSGVGKSTIARRLADKLRLSYTVSATTRPKKPGDDNGKTYDHISKDEFYRRLDAEKFLEYAQVYDELYGTPKHPGLDYLAQGRDVLTDKLKSYGAAKREIHMAKGSRAFDYMVINDDLDAAVEEVIKIIKHKRDAGI